MAARSGDTVTVAASSDEVVLRTRTMASQGRGIPLQFVICIRLPIRQFLGKGVSVQE